MSMPELDVLKLSDAALREKAKIFHAYSIVDVSELLAPELHTAMKAEAETLLGQYGRRRDFRMGATDHTPRRMANVEQKFIAANDGTILNLYDSPRLQEMVAAIVRAPIHPCPYEPEWMVITLLDQEGDTHGWHWDDYSLALVWILDAPDLDAGGILQCVPNTFWDKDHPDVLRFFLNNTIHSYHFRAGQAYLMQTSRTMHRVYPLLRGGQKRLIVNYAFATTEDLQSDISHETVEALWEPIQ